MADTKLDRQVKLSGALPAEDRENGLDHLASQLVDDPEGTLVLALCVLDVKSVTHDIVSDVYVPMLRIREIEGVLLDQSPADVREYMRTLREDRRGIEQDPLPDAIDEELADHLDARRDREEAAREDATVAVVPADEDAVVFHPFEKREGRR